MSIIDEIYTLGEYGSVQIELHPDGNGTISASADSVTETEAVSKSDLDGLATWLQEHGYPHG